MRAIRVNSFRWATGNMLGLIGAMMLVVPHQFSSPVYAALQPALPLWGLAFLAIGMGVVAVAVLSPSPRIELAIHFMAGTALLVLAYGFAVSGAWTGTSTWAVLGLASLLIPMIPRPPGKKDAGVAINLLPLVLGIGSAATGLTVLALPGQFSGPIHDSYRSLLPLFGWSFLLAGVAISLTQIRPESPVPMRISAQLLLAAVFVAYLVEVAWPLRAWTGIAYYGGMSLALLALTPWLKGKFARIDPASFSTRLALLLAAAVTLAMTISAATTTSEQERLARTDAEARMQTAAIFVASDISHYIGSYRSAAAALATYPGLLDLPVDAQRDLLRRYARTYPEANVFSTYDASGRGIARSDDIPPIADVSRLEVFQKVRRTLTPDIEVQISSTLRVPIFAIGAPILGEDGRFSGQIGTSLRSNGVANLINQVNEHRKSQVPGRSVYLVDGAGHAIAHPDENLVASFADLSSSPQVAQLLASPADQGIVSAGGPAGDLLAAYARVPDLGWAVVVQQPVSDALASARAGRDAAFGWLVLAVLLAVVAGTITARWLSGPLAALARAAGFLASGDSSARLPAGGSSEIQNVVAAFADMRDKLAARTEERERLLATEQEARNLAEKAVKVRDEFMSGAAHELKTPVTSLRGYAQVLIRQYEKTGTVDPGRLLKSMKAIDAQSKRLTRLTEQLLNLSRLETGKLTLALEKTDVVGLVENLISAIRHSHPRRTIEFRGGQDVFADVDGDRLEQVVTNLIDNGIKFSDEIAPVEVEVDHDGTGWVKITVRDHGIGIPEEQRGRIFEQFYQAHAERHYGGMGIGLFISRQITEMHGGTITVEQPADGGTSFVVRLPISRAQEDGVGGEHHDR